MSTSIESMSRELIILCTNLSVRLIASNTWLHHQNLLSMSCSQQRRRHWLPIIVVAGRRPLGRGHIQTIGGWASRQADEGRHVGRVSLSLQR
jgi:hypothetical protein